MMGARPADILRQLEESPLTDRELLARFVRERDQSAFREIVTRYGPMVLGVCRRVTHHRQDAEDAFQAVFLILARKAASIKKPEVLGCWLHGVALRVAQTARRSVLRRRAREIAVNAMPELPTSPNEIIDDLAPILDEELAALPSWYREAIILCDLQGSSREDAATALCVPEGTLSSRLAKGRKILSDRLLKRGITLSAAMVPATLSTAYAAAIKAESIAKTCSLVMHWMAGAPIPKPLAQLTEAGLTMRKMLMIGLFSTAVAIAGVVYAAQPAENPSPTESPTFPVTAGRSEDTQKPVADAKLADKSGAFTSTPRLKRAFDNNLINLQTVCWNPGGTRLAMFGLEPEHKDGIAGPVIKAQTIVRIMSLDPPDDNFLFIPADAEKSHFIGFTPDGKHALTELREYQLASGFHRLSIWKEPVVEKNGFRSVFYEQVRELGLPSTETRGYAIAADGKTFRTVSVDWVDPAEKSGKTLDVQEYDFMTGKLVKSLLKVEPETPLLAHALSSNGRKMAVMENREKLAVYDVDRAVRICSVILKGDLLTPIVGVSQDFDKSVLMEFSPDGHKLVVSRGAGQTVVVNSDTGDILPALDSTGTMRTTPGLNAFSGDDRLLALSGTRYRKNTNGHYQVVGFSLAVWDTQTGKAVKTWSINSPRAKVVFNPVRPLLVMLEPNDPYTRIGVWDFSAETAEKK